MKTSHLVSDALADLARRIAALEGTELVLALERRLRPEEVDVLAGRPKGWAYREHRAGRLAAEKDPGGERPGRGRVGALRFPMKLVIAALEERRVEASRPPARRYQRRFQTAAVAPQELAS